MIYDADAPDVTPNSAVAPPGGWTVSVRTIRTIAANTARAVEHHVHPRAANTTTATTAEIRWPPMTLRGLDGLLPGIPKITTDDAPKEATIRGSPASKDRKDTIAIATKAPAA